MNRVYKTVLLFFLTFFFYAAVACLFSGVLQKGLLSENDYDYAAAQSDKRPEKVQKEKKSLTFKGCSIIRRAFMSEAALAYEKATGIKIDVMGGGATLGIRATAAGDADIGGSCRPALPELFHEERGVIMNHIAWDALVFITHPSNSVSGITLEQAKKILLGKITNWKEVGGPDRPIIAVFRSQVPEHGGKVSGVGYMTRIILFNDPSINFTEQALFFKHSAEVEETIEKIEFTFGVTGKSSAKKRSVKMLLVDGVKPNKENISSALYPLMRPLYLITKERPNSSAKEFIDWILSPEGQRVVSQQGTVNLHEGKKLLKKFEFWEYNNVITNPN